MKPRIISLRRGFFIAPVYRGVGFGRHSLGGNHDEVLAISTATIFKLIALATFGEAT